MFNDISQAKKDQEQQERAAAAADLRARRSAASNEVWNLAGKSFKYAEDRDAAKTRLVELEQLGLISIEDRDATTATLSVQPPTPTHAELRAKIESNIVGEPLDAKNMPQAVFDALWAQIGRK